MKNLVLILMAMLMVMCSCSDNKPLMKIGLVADPQYADKPTAGTRYYRESLRKLKEAVDTFNYNRVDFVQTLGDVIDGSWQSYDSILSVYQGLKSGIETHQLLGNHDFSIDSTHLESLLERLSMPDFYYSYNKKGWRFIVLDATDYAYFSNGLHCYDIDQVNGYYEKTKGKKNRYKWNSAIGEEQQKWLQAQLDSAKKSGQRVILFSHLPLRPQGNPHNLWNDSIVTRIIENSPNVVAFINGHNHSGNYVYKNGIHYITIAGMVETMVSSYAVLDIFNDHLVLRGYGNQKSLDLTINR